MTLGPIVNLFVLKEAFHSEKMEGVIPESMTFEQYIVRQITKPRNDDSAT